MKKSIFVLSALFPAFALLTNAYSSEGGTGTHGGDTLVSEFTGTAANVAEEIERQGNPAPCVHGESLQSGIESATVVSSLAIFKEGHERDAWNDSTEKNIEISRSRLIRLEDPLNYATLVLHEYSGIMGIEGTNDFTRSQACIRTLQAHGTDLETLRFRINPLKGVVEELAAGNLILKCSINKGVPTTWIDLTKNRLAFENSNGSITELARSDFGSTSVEDWIASYDIATGKTSVILTKGWGQGRYVSPRATGEHGLCLGFKLDQISEGSFAITFIPQNQRKKPLILGSCTTVSKSILPSTDTGENL